VSFRYTGALTPTQVRALHETFAIYGVRRMAVDEPARTITVEYDATRLTNDAVAAILRHCQVAVGEPGVLA
ncbi:MAG: hypothetical protein ACRD2E_05435, partial [Terriglobales bacterium]